MDHEEDNTEDLLKLNIADPVPYEQQLAEKHAAQSTMTREQVMAQMAAESESTEDFEAMVEAGRTRLHNWHDHGLKRICYDAGHPVHEVWLKH